MRATWSVIALASAFGAGSLGAQQPSVIVVPSPLQALPVSDLTFGTVLAGVMKRVLVHGTEAGVFQIQGPPVASIRVEFVLPVALVAPGGTIPLSFGPGDGFAGATLGSHYGTLFDPHGAVLISLSGSGKLFIRMGGTALPAVPQASGLYHATISMTVYDLGS